MIYNEKTQTLRFLKSQKRARKKRSRKTGWFRYYFAVVKTAKLKGKVLTKENLPVYKVYENKPCTLYAPSLSENIVFLANNKNAFSKQAFDLPNDGVFEVPEVFSLTDNYEESFIFLKKLFNALYSDRYAQLKIDYKKCNKIDVDASVCMDILLQEFIQYYKDCRRRNIKKNLDSISPKNITAEKESLLKMLFSIGAYKNLRGIEVKFEKWLSFPLLTGNNYSKSIGREKEIEVTKIVDYIVDALSRMNKTLTWEAEDSLSKVVGEVLINAAEHSGNKFRYSIGYFEQLENADGNHIGIFNLVIFSFGKTIYQNFKNEASKDLDVVKRMTELSEKYTSSGFFRSKEFEEETLWTLYSLQEGVTSVPDRKRGNGSIHFIESFFNLKGDNKHDNSSFLTIISGNTRIIFDGKYQITEKRRGKDDTLYKMMTFNDSGDIEDKPDSKYVSYTENHFPGTMIVAKICINFTNIETKCSTITFGISKFFKKIKKITDFISK